MDKKKEKDRTNTEGNKDIPGVYTAVVQPGTSEDKRVKLVAYLDPKNGDIKGEIVHTERTKPGDVISRNGI